MSYACIDLGSTSFHCELFKRLESGAFQSLSKLKEPVFLRLSMDEHGCLSPSALERGMVCLKRFGEALKSYQVKEVVAAGTYTLRSITNQQWVLEQFQQALGYPIRVLSGEEEARLIFAGASSKQPFKLPTLLIDIGGGSTELIVGQGREPFWPKSLPIGCASLSKTYFDGEKMDFDAAIAEAKSCLLGLTIPSWQTCLGSAGTIKTLLTILKAQDLGQLITLDLLYRIRESWTSHEILLGLREDRAQVFPGGLSLLIALFETFRIEQMAQADGGLREGLLGAFIS